MFTVSSLRVPIVGEWERVGEGPWGKKGDICNVFNNKD